MSGHDGRRACRHDVSWPARVRFADETEWQQGKVINLSVTGVLFETPRHYRVGDRVEVEIDFLTQPESLTVVSGVGLIVRTDTRFPGRAAVHFAVECSLSRKSDAIAQSARGELL